MVVLQSAEGDSMANWRRGFFRVWILLAIVWAVAVGFMFLPSFLNPYTPPAAFTVVGQDQFERLKSGSARHAEVTNDYVNGRYTMVAFEYPLDGITFFIPHITTVEVEGKNYDVGYTDYTTAELDRVTLVTDLAQIIAKDQPNRPMVELLNVAERAVPQEVKSKYQVPWVKYGSLDYAKALEATVASEQRMSLIPIAAGVFLIPPFVVLLLGAGIGWALSGFRRQPV